MKMVYLTVAPREVSLDGQITKMNDWLLLKDQVHLGSKTNTSARLDISRFMIGKYPCILANTLLYQDRLLRELLERQIVREFPKASLLLYMEVDMSDETPMRVGNRDGLATSGRGSISMGTNSSSQSSEIVLRRFPSFSSARGGTRSMKSKLLQSESMVGMLLQMPVTGKLVFVVGNTLNWTQQLQTTTVEIMYEAYRQRAPNMVCAKDFKARLRLTVLDRASSNGRTERVIAAMRNDWRSINIDCEHHLVATNFKRTVSLTNHSIRGQIHFALSLADGAEFALFKQCVIDVIKERIDIHRCLPPRDASAMLFKRQLITLTVSRGGRPALKQLALTLLPNGGWRDRVRIPVFIPAGVTINQQQLKQSICDGMAQILCHASFKVYPRSRWNGAAEAFDQVALLDGVHGIGRPAFELYMERKKIHGRLQEMAAWALRSQQSPRRWMMRWQVPWGAH